MYQLEIINKEGKVEIELFNKQVEIVSKHNFSERSIRNSIKSGNFIDSKGTKYRVTEISNKKESILSSEEVDDLLNIITKKDNTTLQGDSERKPRMSLEDNLYTIVYGKDKEVKVTEEEVSKMRKLYCTKNGCTIEQLGLEMNMLREEIIAIKTAFNFVKTSIPYTDKEVDTLSVDEMAEDSRIHKKKAYFRKLEDLKIQDMEKELKKLHQKDYYFNKFMNEINIEPIKIDNKLSNYVNDNCSMIISLSDWHIGAKTNNIYNKFNKEIAEKRIYSYVETIKNKIDIYKPEHIYVTNIGDLLNGIIHQANRANSDMNVSESIKFCINTISALLINLNKYAPVTFTGVTGNHSRWLEKTANLDDENFENIILWTLYKLFENNDNIDIIIDNNITSELKIYDRYIAIHHGDRFQDENKFMGNKKRHYEIIIKGHFHNFNIKTLNDTEIVTVGSLIGADDYSSAKQLYSKPSQLITIVDSDWNKTYIPIYFD